MSWEVRTMRSRTSFFNGAVYRRTLARSWPVMAGIALVLFFWLVFPIARVDPNGMYGDQTPAQTAYAHALYATENLSLLTCLTGLVGAAVTFSFLYQKRSAGMMAALPLRREGLFLSSWLAGLTALLAPAVLMASLAAVLTLTRGQTELSAVLTWLAVYSMETVIFYGAGVFCAMLTGQMLVLIPLYALFSFGGALLSVLLQSMARLLLVGVPTEGSVAAFDWLNLLSPCTYLEHVTGAFHVEDAAHAYTAFFGWQQLGIYLAAGLALTALALWLFRRRKMECAQEPVSIRWLGPALKYIVTLFCALALPSFLAMVFTGDGSLSGAALLAYTALGAVIGFVISEMILRKSLRIGRRGWLGVLAAAAVACGIVGALQLDVFGYVHRVPEPEAVDHADVWAWYDLKCTVSEPESLETLTTLHRDLIGEQTTSVYGVQDLTIVYHLKNGRTLSRTYQVSDYGSPDSPGTRLQELIGRSDVTDRTLDPVHPLTDTHPIYGAEITWTEPMEGEPGNTDLYTGTYISQALTPEQALDLYENGVRSDLEAGAYPHWVLDGAAYYASDPVITIHLYWNDTGTQELRYRPNANCTNTLAWLQAHGYTFPELG